MVQGKLAALRQVRLKVAKLIRVGQTINSHTKAQTNKVTTLIAGRLEVGKFLIIDSYITAPTQ